MAVQLGVASPTTAVNSFVPFNYTGTAATLPLAIGFIPSAVMFWGSTYSWTWVRGMAFGDAKTATITFGNSNPNTACVLDVLDGSGNASTNVATTSKTIGILLGTNTVVNNGGSVVYFGLCFR